MADWTAAAAKRPLSSQKREYRARQKNGSQVARIFQARPGRSGKQQQEQNSRNLGTFFLPGPVYLFAHLADPSMAPKLRLIGVQNHFVYSGVVDADLEENHG